MRWPLRVTPKRSHEQLEEADETLDGLEQALLRDEPEEREEERDGTLPKEQSESASESSTNSDS